MATPVKKWLLRVAPWFLPVGIVAVWQLASSVGWLSTRILPSPEGVVTAFWTLSTSSAEAGAKSAPRMEHFTVPPPFQVG